MSISSAAAAAGTPPVGTQAVAQLPGRWSMPAETAPHACTWMAWPGGGYTLGATGADADEARATWAAVTDEVARAYSLADAEVVTERDER